MLSEVSLVDRIEVLCDTGHICVRRADHVVKDGTVIATTYHRHVLTPGMNLDVEVAAVRRVAQAAWSRIDG